MEITGQSRYRYRTHPIQENSQFIVCQLYNRCQRLRDISITKIGYMIKNYLKIAWRIYRVMRGYDSTKPRVAYLSAPYATASLNDFPGQIKKTVRVGLSNRPAFQKLIISMQK